MNDQLNSVESEMESFQSGVNSAAEPANCEDEGTFFYESIDTVSFVDSHFRIPTSVKSDDGDGKQDLKPINEQNSQDSSKLEDAGDLYALAEMCPAGCAVSKKSTELFFDSESPWMGGERTEWRTADRDELALMVTQISSGLIENCDLPQPQMSRIKKEPIVDPYCFDQDGIFVSSIDQKNPGARSLLSVHNPGALASVDGHLQSVAVKPLSDSTIQAAVPKRVVPDNDPGKAQLLEALRHSQTRAREAEKAAQQADAEKEHVTKLVFRQASQLFAYNQWFQLLQLENLYFQIKHNKKEPIPTLFPVMLPWVPQKTRKSQKRWQKAGKGKRAKRGRPRCDLNKYAVVFALGLSLVGAGLLLGWTVGWMLPAF